MKERWHQLAAKAWTRARPVLTATLCVASLTACAGAIPIGNDRVGNSFALGENLVGESCRAEAANESSKLAAAGFRGEAFEIYCGEWEQPSAQVLKLPGSGSGVGALVTGGAWHDRLALKAACEAPVSSQILDGIEALVLDCRLRDGGWPYAAFGAAEGGALYLADGIPAAQPVMERAVASLSGRAATDTIRSAAIDRLEAQLGGRFFGTGELRDYQLLLQIGSYYNGIKNFPEAEKRYREALEIHQRVLGPGDPEFGDPLMHLALEASNQERFTVADALFAEAGPLVRQAADRADFARYISYLGLHEANQRNYDAALEYARRATGLRKEIASEVGGQGDVQSEGQIISDAVKRMSSSSIVLQSPANVAAIDVAQSLAIEAAMLNRSGDPKAAARTASEAMSVVEASAESPQFWRPQILELATQISLKLERYRDAERQIVTALQQRELTAKGTRPYALDYLELGRVYLAQGRPAAARDAYRTGLAVVRERSESLRLDQIRPYLDLLWNTVEADPGRTPELAAEMFDAAQLVRGAVAAQNISDAAARLSSSDQEVGAIIRELQDARRQRDSLLFRFNALAAKATTPEDRLALEDLRKQIAGRNAAIAELEPQAQAAAPGLNILHDEASSFEQLSPILLDDEAVLQIIVGDAVTYVFFLRAGEVSVQRVDVTREVIAQAVNRLRQAFIVRRSAGGASVDPYDARLAFVLYQRLLGPFAAQLAGVGHLVTVPSGPLLSLPLGLLVTEAPPEIVNSDYSQVAWLLKTTSVSLAPSVRAFVDLRTKAKASSAPKPFLGLGDFLPSQDPEAILNARQLPEGCLPGAEAVAFAPALPETAVQVQAMAKSFGVGEDSLVLGENFTEAAVNSLPLDEYRVLVFATHGLLPGELDCLSEPSLLVSRPASAGPEADGLLTYSEIFELDLDADVVVLSACNTGGPLSQGGRLGQGASPAEQLLGQVVDQGEADRVRGESLAGLARAFFYAGTRSLLVSNWEVYTEATVALMTATFAGLQEGDAETLAAALQQAKLGFIGDPNLSHPYLWGSFALIGDGALAKAGEVRPVEVSGTTQ